MTTTWGKKSTIVHRVGQTYVRAFLANDTALIVAFRSAKRGFCGPLTAICAIRLSEPFLSRSERRLSAACLSRFAPRNVHPVGPRPNTTASAVTRGHSTEIPFWAFPGQGPRLSFFRARIPAPVAAQAENHSNLQCWRCRGDVPLMNSVHL